MLKKIFKFTSLGLLILIVFSFICQLSQNNPKGVKRYLEKNGYLSKPQNQLVYSVKFLGVLPVGNAIIDKEKEINLEDRSVYYLTAEVEPYKYIARFFKFKARIESYIAQDSKLPLIFRQTIEMQTESGEANKEVIYNQEKHTMTLRGEERVILPDTHDPLSAIRYLRNADLNKLKDFDLSLNTNQKNYGMKGEAIKEDDFWVLTANIARRDKNNPYHRSRITLYLLDNPEKTPILIKVMASGAYIVARLVDIR